MHHTIPLFPSTECIYVGTIKGTIKEKHMLWEKEKEREASPFHYLQLRCWLPLADYRVVSVVHGLQWHQTRAQAYCRESNSLNSFRKTLFDHSKGNSRAPCNSRTLECKSSRNVNLVKSWRRQKKVLPTWQTFFSIRDSLIVFRIR